MAQQRPVRAHEQKGRVGLGSQVVNEGENSTQSAISRHSGTTEMFYFENSG